MDSKYILNLQYIRVGDGSKARDLVVLGLVTVKWHSYDEKEKSLFLSSQPLEMLLK